MRTLLYRPSVVIVCHVLGELGSDLLFLFGLATFLKLQGVL